MADEPASVRLLREALEEVLSPARAAAVVFDGLEAWGHRAPVRAEELSAALRGPVRDALLRRLEPARVDEVIQKLAATLATAEAPTDVHPALGEPGPDIDVEIDVDEDLATNPLRTAFPEEHVTLPVRRRAAPVPVLVLAGTGAFAARLRLALGAERVAPRTQLDLTGGADLLGAAAVVVVDATDIPPLDPEALGRALSGLPRECIPAVWGADLPFGRLVTEAAGTRTVTIARRDGIEPLVDLVRSLG